MESSLNWDVSLTHLKPSNCNFWGITHLTKLLTCKHLRHNDSLFLSNYFMHLLLAFSYRWIAWHSPFLIPFSTINNISISVNRPNFTFEFLILLVMLILVQQENEQGKIQILQDTYSESSQKPQLPIMYSFEHTNHSVNLNVLFQDRYKLFLRVCNLHQ